MPTISHQRSSVKKNVYRKKEGCKGSQNRAHKTRNQQRKRNWEKIQDKYVPRDLDAIARSQEALIRRRKVQGAEDLLRLAMAYALTDKGFRGIASWATNVGIAVITSEALRKRLRGANTWMAHLVALQLLGRQRKEITLPQRTAVIQDATFLSVPGSKGMSHRVHVVMDLATERIVRIEVTDDKGGETLKRFPFSSGDLVIGDRIYGTRYSIAAVVAAGADVLVRLKWNVPLLDANGNPINLVKEARRCPEEGSMEIDVWTPADEVQGTPSIKARVVICRRSSQAGDKARRDLNREAKKKGYTPSADALEAQDYLFLLTTVSAEELPKSVVLLLYRLRWRVEILFKRHKSVLKLDEIQVKTPALVETVVYTKILAALWEEEALWQWQEGFLSQVPDPEAVMVPRWRMMRILRECLKEAIGLNLEMDEWIDASDDVNRKLIEPPRKRTRERNARIQQALDGLKGAPICA
jgi:hypothetical protein